LLVADTCYPILEKAGGGALAIEWRKAISRVLFSDYISPGQAFFQLKSQKNDVDNPDQRIGQDCMEFCEKSVVIVSGFVWCQTTQLVFAIQLFNVPVMGPTIATYQLTFLVGFAIVMLCLIGPPIVRITRLILAEEANLRFALIRVRENAEPIAFYRGYTFELERVFDVFRSALWLRYRALALEICQALAATASLTFPHLIVHFTVGPAIIDGTFEYGQLAQTLFFFDIMLIALSATLLSIPAMSQTAAQAVRIVQLINMLDNVNNGRDVQGVPEEMRKIIRIEELDDIGNDIALQVTDVIFQPPGFPTPTVRDLNITLYKGESCLLAGPSGIGKSSILRVCAGLWVDGSGTIKRCPLDLCFMLPQETYLCLGTLRSNIIYPELEDPDDDSGRFTDLNIQDALDEANLSKLYQQFHLDDELELKGILSGGEKQRLSFARLVLRESMKITILDEATAALDLANEEKMYKKMMAKTDIFLSVGHRPTLDRFHSHRLLLERPEGSSTAVGMYEKLDPDNLPSAQLAREMAARGEA
jgi:putative ATP-binding cassette transporter